MSEAPIYCAFTGRLGNNLYALLNAHIVATKLNRPLKFYNSPDRFDELSKTIFRNYANVEILHKDLLLRDKDLATAFDTDFVLVIQQDTKIMNVSAWDNDFFNYDYIGAPWALTLGWLKKFLVAHKKDPDNKDFYVGNGGFSLRSKKLCELVAKKNAEKENKFHEDTFICCNFRDFFEKNGVKFAPYTVAQRFAVENDEYTNQFGAHKNVLKAGKKVPVKDL